MSTDSLAAEFRELRRLRGHFSNPPAPSNPVVDHWEGRKHQVMRELGRRLETGNPSKEEVVRLLGEPDERAPRGQEPNQLLKDWPADAASESLIYYWRGRHDFLFFVCKDTSVVKVSWYMAYE